jgi:uncharacterized tellurite resistance protein B-like protein
MIWLSTSTVARLRDQLQTRGARPSIAFDGDPTKITPDAAELMTVSAEFGPICEAMYLMMSADGSIGDVERDVLRGAIKNLSQDSVRTAHIDAMLEQAAKAVAEQGRETRLREVISSLQDDPARGEVAFVLAAAIAFADNAIADEENETLNLFAEGLGIDDARANQLLDSIEKDLGERGSGKS